MKIFKGIKLGHVVFLALVTVAAPICSAQQNDGVGNLPPSTTTESKMPELDQTSIDLRFTESTNLRNVIDMIPKQMNLVLERGLDGVIVAPIELRNASFRVVLESLSVATAREIEYDLNEGVAFIYRNREFSPAKESEISVHVINVTEILDEQEVAEASLLSALEIGLEMNNSSPKNVGLKLHKETKLLFMRASAEDARVVYEIVDRLNPSAGDPFGL